MRIANLTPAAAAEMAELVAPTVTRADAIVGSVQLRMFARQAPQPEARELLERLAAALTLAGAS